MAGAWCLSIDGEIFIPARHFEEIFALDGRPFPFHRKGSEARFREAGQLPRYASQSRARMALQPDLNRIGAAPVSEGAKYRKA